MSEGKKLNPRFIMGGSKKKTETEKQLDEIAVVPKKVVRRNWAGGAGGTLSKNDEAEETTLAPSLASNAVVVDFVDDAVDNPVDNSVDNIVDNSVDEAVDNFVEEYEDDDVLEEEPVENIVEDSVDIPVEEAVYNGEDNLVEEEAPPVTLVRPRAVNSRFDLGRAKPRPLVTPTSGGAPFKGAKMPKTGMPARKPDEEHIDQRPSVLRAKSAVDAGDWNDTYAQDDTTKGFNAEGNTNTPEPELGTGFHLTERDIMIIRFLARYRYAYNFQIARLCDTSPKAINIRLRKLAERGFIKKKTVTGAQYIWLSTKAGNLVADIDLPAIKDGQLSWVTVAHTIGLGNVGVELEIGGDNLLKEDEWPVYNKRDRKGNPVIGERILTEKEIRQGQQKWRMNRTTAEMRELVESAIKDTGAAYVNEETGEITYPDAPELIEGNEGLYVVYGALEHIPDMVVQRGRDADGKPINIAIELELNQKPSEDWKRILRTYRDYGQMYDKIIYFTHKRSIFNLLNKINQEDIGLPPERFMIRQYKPKNDREPFWG